MARRFNPQLLSSARAEQAGFTLVELMVAMTGGLFLSIVVFALSRDASRFYQSETRAANATLAGVTGFERLSSDIARAGHLVSPNITNDPRVCNRPLSGGPVMLVNLRAITIGASSDLAGTELAAAGITPMAIELAGSLDVTEELPINHVGPNIDEVMAVTLRDDTPAARRLKLKKNGPTTAGENKDVLLSLFKPGGEPRAVRITQLDGMEQYALVADVLSEPLLQITLTTNPALQFRSDSATSAQCGFRGFNTGGSINVINFIRYALRPMTGEAAYASLFTASKSAGLPYEAGRVELIREELKPMTGEVMPGTTEIVAEYAVDLQFSVKQATSALDPALIEPAPATITSAYGFTQYLRGVHVRFSVRSREADRQADVTGMPAGDLYRIGLGASAGAPFARVRTFQADVPLRNLEGANW